MNLSRYILKYSTDDGTLYFNTKTNHSFFLTNELNRVVDSNDVIRKVPTFNILEKVIL